MYLMWWCFLYSLCLGSLLTSTQVSLPVKQPFHSAVQPSNSMLHMLNTNGYSLPPSLTSLQITLPSSPIASYPSPSPSPITSPVMSPANSPSLSQRSCSGNINWTLRQHSRGVNVCDWLRNLRLHKYSEVFKGKTFNEVNCSLNCSEKFQVIQYIDIFITKF